MRMLKMVAWMLSFATTAIAAEPADLLLLAGGTLPLCSSLSAAACSGAVPDGRRDAPAKFEPDANGQRPREVVDFNGSKSTASKAIYLHFVAMAKAAHLKRTGKPIERPVIGILTASSVDPFDPVDFYLDAFHQAGAAPLWLPLDAAVRASFGGNCDAIGATREQLTGDPDRAKIYPDLAAQQRAFCLDRSQLTRQLETLDGLFFNGGDQSLTRAAWFDGARPIPEFALLKARVSARTLAIGGTSAGTAVMSQKTMITNGVSAVALRRGAKNAPPPPVGCDKEKSCPKGLVEDDLTYDPTGGLGLFPLGTLDTHFAARDRQGRLAQLLLDSGTDYGFGVDETTALLLAPQANGYRLRAIGAGAVWIYDAKRQRQVGALMDKVTRLKPGQTLNWPP